MKEAILVTGASSRNGSALLRHLVARGERVRAASRQVEALGQLDVEVCHFDWQRSKTYEKALVGVDRVFLIVPEERPGAPEHAGRFVFDKRLSTGLIGGCKSMFAKAATSLH